MPGAANEQQWKDRYRELVHDFEDKEREWASLEKALRGAAGKLALAAMGQSDELDTAVEAVLNTLRTDLSPPQLDASITGLVRALQTQGVPGEIVAPAATSKTAELPKLSAAEPLQLFQQLVRSIGSVKSLRHVAAALELKLDGGIEGHAWPSFVTEVADAVNRVVGALQSQREELERFLEQITPQLSEFERWTAWQQGAANSRRDDSLGLERSVQREMTSLQRDMDAVGDVTTLKSKVQTRLDTVGQQLLAFRTSEERRHADNEKRTNELRSEVQKLRDKSDELAKVCADQESRLMVDSLTGAHSRYAYESRLAEEFNRWQRHPEPLTFTIWDIDSFKRINDDFGHDAGDRLLRGVAEIIARNKRAEDFFARIGGEEFVLLLPATALAAAVGVAEKIRQIVAKTVFHHHGRTVPVTISCGLTEFRTGDTPATVYERADRALYTAKEGGRNRCVEL
jgi:diguanylate cyclase